VIRAIALCGSSRKVAAKHFKIGYSTLKKIAGPERVNLQSPLICKLAVEGQPHGTGFRPLWRLVRRSLSASSCYRPESWPTFR